MSPRPLENLQGPMVPANTNSGFIQTGVGTTGQQEIARTGGSISMAMLFDFIIQRTYHELTVLAELLPRKTDLERKIEIYNFSARTRQLFIRLLALVKWANSASKVDKSAHIMSFLDKQSMLFVDTADMLARMARETLVHARLPNFHIPAAVEVLTTGTYGRLPACIKEKIIPPEPITTVEKRQTLQRLNQVIQHRLVTGDLLPQMRKFKIDCGRVTFRVEHEFEVALTVMGDGPNVPWRLLEIEILVEDKDTGNGKPLVHSLQVNYIHQVIQTRLVDNPNALAEVYNCLHFFCQSLQMEVLYTQTLKLIMDRLGDDIHVDEYQPGVKLTVSYWRELTSKDPKSELGYKLTIKTDPNDKTRPLAVLHLPTIGTKESFEVADRAVRTDLLSMERLLVHTVYIRSLTRLNDIKTEFQTFLKDVDFHLQGTPAILTIPVLNPCLRAEQIHITVDTHTGMLRCHVPKHLDCPVIPDLQTALNGDLNKLPTAVSELRYWVTQRRCEKTLQHLPATPHERLPLLHTTDHPLAKLSRHKLFVKFNRHPTVILIVEIKEHETNSCEMEFSFYLAFVKHSSIDENISDDTIETNDIPKVYLKVQTLIEFDSFAVTHGAGTYVTQNIITNSLVPTSNITTNNNNNNNTICDSSTNNKRKLNGYDLNHPHQPPIKQQKNPSYFVPELAHVVNMCDERLPYICLAQDLSNRNIPHSGLQVEANSSSLVLKILSLPQPGCQHTTPENKIGTSAPIISDEIWKTLQKRLLSVSVRTQFKLYHPGVWSTELYWSLEFVFYGTPLQSTHHREQGSRRAVRCLYECLPAEQMGRTVDQILDDWAKIVYLYTIVDDFAGQYKNEKLNLQNMITIKSYTYTNLLLGYGPNKEVTVNIFWCTLAKEFKMIFTGSNSAINAHSMMREQLQSHLNSNYDLAQVVHMLHETYEPLSAVARLSIIPQLGIPRPLVPVLSFCILPQSPTILKVVYQAMYCLEFCLRGGGLVSIRDGAHSRFAKRNVLDEFTPTQGLKGFLTKYVDESLVYRRRSQSEDDNPPSPAIIMEDGPHSVGGSSPFLTGGSGGLRAPQSPRDAGLRFAPPLTPPTISNPHTPASPHPAINQSNQHNFGMTSPPSMPHPSPSGGGGGGGGGGTGTTGLMPASPLNPQPSPMAAHSPGPNLAYLQNHPDSSPFGVLSPAAAGTNWPGSPGMPRPSPRPPGQSPEHKSQIQVPHISRILPARSWAGATPTLLTDEALDTLCRPCPHPQKDIPGPDLCPLERFLGCGFMRRNLQRFIQAEECLTGIQCDQPGVVLFKADSLQCQVFLNSNHMQSLHIKISQIPITPVDVLKPPFQWNLDDLHIIERFFDTKVVAPPYRPNALCGFGRMLNVPPPVLRDFIQIIRLELMPEILPGLKWQVQFCMRSPPSAVPVVPTAVVMIRMKILFFLQITRIPYMPGMEWKDSMSFVLPMVYDISSNITQLAERRENSGYHQSISTAAVSNMLRRFAEYSAHPGECSIFPAVRDLLLNLTLPNEPQPPTPQQQQQQVALQNQIIPSPAGVASSPSPMMHSPMQQQQHQQSMNQQGGGGVGGVGGGGGGGGVGGSGPGSGVGMIGAGSGGGGGSVGVGPGSGVGAGGGVGSAAGGPLQQQQQQSSQSPYVGMGGIPNSGGVGPN